MDVIHFTEGATIPLREFGEIGARFVPLAQGHGTASLSALHLEPGARLQTPSISHAAALLVVHGRIKIVRSAPASVIVIHAGMGAVFGPEEPYAMECEEGAVALIVEADGLIADARGISTPERIAGQRWPGDDPKS